METLEVESLANSFLLYIAFKVMLLLFLIFYNIFAVLVIRQVQVMNQTIQTAEKDSLALLAKAHLAFAGLVFVLILIFF